MSASAMELARMKKEYFIYKLEIPLALVRLDQIF